MLSSDRMYHRSTALAAELRDALGRRQKELPARWLTVPDHSPHPSNLEAVIPLAEDAEVSLSRAVLERHLADMRPRGVICVHPSSSRAALPLVAALLERSDVTMGAVVERDGTVARDLAQRVQEAGVGRRNDALTVAPLAADCTVNLPLPNGFPRPRLFLCLGNTLGAVTAVGAVRMLRALRATMTPNDAIVLGLATAVAAGDESSRERDAAATHHLDALRRINEAFGSCLDLGHFACESRYDVEQRRLETHLVARRALEVYVPGVRSVRLRKGESIRTTVTCTFDRGRVMAMLGGVGLSLRAWEVDGSGRTAVAVACPAP